MGPGSTKQVFDQWIADMEGQTRRSCLVMVPTEVDYHSFVRSFYDIALGLGADVDFNFMRGEFVYEGNLLRVRRHEPGPDGQTGRNKWCGMDFGWVWDLSGLSGSALKYVYCRFRCFNGQKEHWYGKSPGPAWLEEKQEVEQ